MLKVNQLIGFGARRLSAGGTPMYAAYVGSSYQNPASEDTYTFNTTPIGTAHASRVLVAAVCQVVSTLRTVASVVLDGTGNMNKVVEEGAANNCTHSIWYIPWATGTTANIVVTNTGGGNTLDCRLSIYELRPTSGTPVDFASGTGATPFTIADVELKNGGFMVVAGYRDGNSGGLSLAWSGSETPVHDLTAAVADTGSSVDLWSIAGLADTTTNDLTFTGSGGRGVVASWF